ncbi:MAG TPA: cadherin domain-containing protein, partial [Clostridia bacterium]|nr:cadherin domain-containing protein [Clostridia bacterium]
TQLPVQYELFVNITNLVNPSLTELNRRVVVAIIDVNERPTLSGFTVSVLERVQPGTLIGTVEGDDQDFYNLLSYAIVSGDPNGLFTLGENNGQLRVAGELIRSQQAVHSILIRVSDQVGPVSLMTTSQVTVVVLPNNTPFTPGGIHYTIYPNLTGTTMPGLTNAASFPGDPGSERLVTLFEGDTDRGSDFGSVMRGYLIAPVSGNYTFWIATDDDGELWMSTSTNRAGMTRIAYIANGHTAPRVWNKYASQRSAQRALVAGQAYYIEARQKESGGGDNLAVAWTGPGQPGTNVIPGAFLAPYTMNYRPKLTGFTASLRPDTITGARLGRVALTDVNDQAPHTFTILSGNEDGIFGIDQDGWVLLANAAALQASPYPSYALLVRCTDSGALSADASVFLNVVDSNAVVPLSLQREMFYNINGNALNALLTSPKYPRLVDELVPMNDFIAPVDVAENFGSRVRGYLIAPVTGTYRFFIASDDASQLRMSSSDNPAAAAVIAAVSGYSGPNQWNKEAGQMSALRSLVGGQRYYLEALHKEGGSADHLAVAWLMPGSTETNVIPAGSLEPADINLAPLFNNQVMGVPAAVPNGTFIGALAATDSPLDTLAWQILAGNTGDTFALDPATGRLTVANNTLIADGSVSSFVLTMLVQDSGLGGLYPLRSAQATVTINVLGPNTPLVWTGAAADARWAQANNWRGVTPDAGARLVFGYPMQQATVNDAVSTLAWVQFTNGGFSVTGNPVTLQTGLTNSGNNTWDLDTALAAPQAWNNAAGGTLTISGAITNAGHMMSLVTGGDVRLLGSVTGAGGINKTGGARLLMAGTHSYTGPTIVAAASGTATALEVTGLEDLVLNSDLTLNGRMDLWNRNATVGGLNGTGIIFANDSTRVLTVGANDHSGTFSGVLSNASYSSSAKLALVKAGVGTQHLSGLNRFSGGTVVRAGTLNINHASALGQGEVTLTDAESGTNSVSLTLS